MCPAGINAYQAAGHMGPALQRVSCPHAPSCDSVGGDAHIAPHVPPSQGTASPTSLQREALSFRASANTGVGIRIPRPQGRTTLSALLHTPPCDFVGDGVPDVPRVRRRGTSLFCLRRVTFVSSDKSHQKRRLKLRFKTSSRASAMISRRPVPRATGFPVFSGSKDCASSAFRDALSRDAAPCRGGCLDALPRGYRQISHHDGRLCPPHMTAAPRRAGPMCPAAHRCGDLSARPRRGRRPRRPHSAKRCHSEPVRTLAWESASPARRGGQLARPCFTLRQLALSSSE